MADEEIMKLAVSKKWDDLINSDQLMEEIRAGHVFEGWKAGLINFPPTYKYEINSDRYVGEHPKEGEKRRPPGWPTGPHCRSSPKHHPSMAIVSFFSPTAALLVKNPTPSL